MRAFIALSYAFYIIVDDRLRTKRKVTSCDSNLVRVQVGALHPKGVQDWDANEPPQLGARRHDVGVEGDESRVQADRLRRPTERPLPFYGLQMVHSMCIRHHLDWVICMDGTWQYYKYAYIFVIDIHMFCTILNIVKPVRIGNPDAGSCLIGECPFEAGLQSREEGLIPGCRDHRRGG